MGVRGWVAVFLFLEQKIACAIQVVSIDQVHAVGQDLAPEGREIWRAPKAHTPALGMGFVDDFLQLNLLVGRELARAAPMKGARPVAADPRDQSWRRVGVQILQIAVQSGITEGFPV